MNFDGGNLETAYNKLSKAFERSETEAAAVHGRIDSVESVAKALFAEWRGELKQYSNENLRRESKRQYDATVEQYEQLMQTMRGAAATMDPVLAAFRDQVLFLKHKQGPQKTLLATSVKGNPRLTIRLLSGSIEGNRR